jgi:hypothetical protein
MATELTKVRFVEVRLMLEIKQKTVALPVFIIVWYYGDK